MHLPSIRLIYDRKNQSTPSKPAPISLEICFKRKRKWIATGISVLPSQWKNGMIVGCQNRFDLNSRLDMLKRKYQEYVDSLILANEEFSFEKMNEYFSQSALKESFIDYVAQRIENRNDIKESTKKTHRKLITALKDFGLILSFKNLTKKNVLLFDEWLHNQAYQQTTVRSYHKYLKTYIHDAIIHEKISLDPYIGIKIERGKSAGRKYLTTNEIKLIISSDNIPRSLENVRDLFIFQCFTGLAYVDMANFDFSKVIHRDGKYILQDKRIKSGEDYYLVLLSPAIAILKKYDFVLPIMTNQQYNLRLKSVAAAVGLERNLTSHMARHSYAVMCLNNGISMESLAKMMGHSNTNTTQIYAKLLNSSLENDFLRLESVVSKL